MSSARSRWRTPRPTATRMMFAEAGTYVINPNLYQGQAADRCRQGFHPGHRPRSASIIRSWWRPNFPVNNVAELIDWPKQKPGEITYGTAGIGSGPHVNVARFENAAKVKLNPDPLPRRHAGDQTTSWAATPT